MSIDFGKMLREGRGAGWLLSLSLIASCSWGEVEPPALVVYVAVDQLRGDLVERYDAAFTGGFRRLLDQGLRFPNTTHDHGITTTAVGHSTLSTGLFPNGNGIVDNDWLERTPGGWRSVYCYEDTLEHILGYPAMPGRSPRNLLRGGLGTWIADSDSGAIIASISRKDRAAIAMAGSGPGHVYWITQNEGQFVTSSFYADAYPTWVERFNRVEMPRIFGDSVWLQTASAAAEALARPDSAAYEGDGIHTAFPHRFRDESRDPDRSGALNRWAYAKTHPDAAVGAFAREAIRELGLGQDGITDYLGLSFSQTDAVGHDFGPRSQEQLENLLHLDRVLGELMSNLDEAVGEGRWLMALTGDHGAMDVPEFMVERGEDAGRSNREDRVALRAVFTRHKEMDGEPMDVADALVLALEELPFVADALTVAELTGGPPADSLVTLMRNSYHPDRWTGGYGSEGTGVLFRPVEGFYLSSDARGSGHGSPYYYDRHVPLILFGANVEPGVRWEAVRTVDIAPTLARLAGIPIPTNLDGVPLLQ